MMSNVVVRSTISSAQRTPPADSLVLDFLRDRRRSTIEADVDELFDTCGIPTATGLDFLVLSAAIYVADKKVLRRSTPDRWTREFYFDVPVSDPVTWTTASPALAETLGFLTGDRWAFTWRGGHSDIQSKRQFAPARFDSVCLFSGGLDSLVGAIDLLERNPNTNVLLLGHYDSRLTPGSQQVLADALADEYGSERVHLLQISVRPAPPNLIQLPPLPPGRETTTRSRSIVFIALGLAAASAQGPGIPLYVPENGFIALNVPLIDARLGSSSTRTTHPHFFACLRKALNNVGITNPIINPYLLSTKGELVANCRNQALLSKLAPFSISCSHPEAARYDRGKYGNCGYCFPCLIRRASLHTIGLDNGTDYHLDACRRSDLVTGRGARGRDLRAILTALAAANDPVRRGASAPALAGPLHEHSAQEFRRVYELGLTELRNLFLDKAHGDIRQYAGM